MSAVFDAVRALYNLWNLNDQIASANAVVFDGPVLSGDLRDTLAVGVPAPGVDGSAAITVTTSGPNGLLANPGEEFAIGCWASVVDGDGEHQPARDRVEALFALAVEAVHKDMTLGGVVHIARLGPWSLWQLSSDRGSEMCVHFTIVGFTQL
jgi:hypothetical protein